MGYTTNFSGRFNLDKPLKPEHLAYLNKFSETRRMKRDAGKTARLPDPVRLAVSLPIGTDACYFVGGGGFAGQDRDASILEYNNAPEGQPGLWCQWVPTEDGLHIEWNEAEKFYDYTEWLQYICDHFLSTWGYTLNGDVTWQGEDRKDRGVLRVVDNQVTAHEGRSLAGGTMSVALEVPEALLKEYKAAKDEEDMEDTVDLATEIADLVVKAAKL